MLPSNSADARLPAFNDALGLSIVGLGVEYPPFRVGPEAIETLATRHYPKSPAIDKVVQINRYTGIETRAAVGSVDHPLINAPDAPSIKQLNTYFMDYGVKLSVAASRKALSEWGGDIADITHVVSTTCTNSANPGFDHYVSKELGLGKNVEKILLHGVGCSGGMAAIRTASNIALGSSFTKRPARILVVACEICTLLVRSELDSVAQNQETRIGCCLFSDCASACIVSNNFGELGEPVYDLLGWKHEVIADTDKDLGFDVDPLGWKVTLSPKVPHLAVQSVQPTFDDMLKCMPAGFHSSTKNPRPADFDWALHPGGSTIIEGVHQALQLPDEALMASMLVYMQCGNSSSATIMSVMDKLRRQQHGKEDVVACAFGPGILIEMMLMKRRHFPGKSAHQEHNGHCGHNGHECQNGGEVQNGYTRADRSLQA